VERARHVGHGRERLYPSLAWICDTSGSPHGAGFLIESRQLLTCAHVVAAAVGIDAADVSPPTDVFGVRFTHASDTVVRRARVQANRWFPSGASGQGDIGAGDIALVDLLDDPPRGASPVPPLARAEPSVAIQVYGLPRGHGVDAGGWANGSLAGTQASGWIQIDGPTVGYRIQRGFSGAPAWCDDLAAVVGMIVAEEQDEGARIGFMIPADFISERCPEVPIEQSPLTVTTTSATSAIGAFGFIPADIGDFVGRTDEIDQMATFGSEQRSGVCLLHGFGGCGKSATLKKFALDTGLLRPSAQVEGQGVFMWSFSQYPSLARFFQEFRAWVDPLLLPADRLSATGQEASYLDLPDVLSRSRHQAVLILDALEVVAIEDNAKPSRDGSLAIPALRALIQRVAEHGCGYLTIYCTSRVVPPELKHVTAPTLRTMDLSQLPSIDGAALLKKKGVKGSDPQLARLVADLRNHAYSIALMGSLLRRVFRGDIRQAPRVLGAAKELVDPIREILNWYEAQLDDHEIRYLQAISVFWSPVTQLEVAALMRHLFRSEAGEDEMPLRPDVELIYPNLADLGLVFAGTPISGKQSVVMIHPIVRQYFYHTINGRESMHRDALRIVSEMIPETATPTDAQDFALLKELVFQALRAKETKLAWKVYSERIGGYPEVGYQLADHPSGTALVDMFLSEGPSLAEHLPPAAILDLYVDGALYLANEGRLDDAVAFLHQLDSERLTPDRSDDRPASTLLVRAGLELLRGDLASSRASIQRAQAICETLWEHVPEATEIRLRKELITRSATLQVATGEEAVASFEAAEAIPFIEGTVPHDYGPIRHVWALALLGQFDDAEALAEKSLVYVRAVEANMLIQRLAAMAAISASWAMRFDRADKWTSLISAWALKADIHVAVLNWLQRGVYAFRKGELEAADNVLRQGSEVAGNSGFLLEWLDMTALRAVIALIVGKGDQAALLADAVIGGDAGSFLLPLRGARDPSVQYVWPLAPAVIVRQRSDGGDSVPTQLPDSVRTVAASENCLYQLVSAL
jgi:tetratricopeptide (TPR) repeat protein